MPFALTSCIMWKDERGVTYCIKKYEKENGAFYCKQEVIQKHVDIDECKKMARSGAMYYNKIVTRW